MAALRPQCGPDPRPAPGPFGPPNRHTRARLAVGPRSPWRRNWLVWERASHRPALAGFLAGLRGGRVPEGTRNARTRRRATGAERPPGAEGERVRESTFEAFERCDSEDSVRVSLPDR